ncbi:MAG: hypothetical protein HZB56_16275 [Deltaproteobacteria bacterium]|nr:hypothetical protein [Deltaproteobacteria bacterium]
MRARTLAPLLLLAAGCASDFDPRSYLADLRVLALVADRPEIGFAESTTVTARTWPEDRAATGTWSFCPYSVGSSVGYDCVVPACEQPLPAGASVAVAPQPLTLAFAQCVQALGGGAGLPPGVPGAPPGRVETVVRYTVRDAAGAVTREAVLRLPVTYPDPPASPNHNPVILRVEIDGQAVLPPSGGAPARLVRGGKLPVRAVLDAPEITSGGTPEGSVLSFYATAGRFDFDRAIGPDGSAELEGKELVAGVTTAQIWVVARDLRGGQAVAGPFDVEVQP